MQALIGEICNIRNKPQPTSSSPQLVLGRGGESLADDTVVSNHAYNNASACQEKLQRQTCWCHSHLPIT
jgi:hypothetical protein